MALIVLCLLLASCSWPWENPNPGIPNGSPHVSVTFPNSPPGLSAKVETLKITDTMRDALPSGATLHEGVSLTMVEGSFPANGALIAFELDAPLADDREANIGYWNANTEEWEISPSELSSDRRVVSAKVSHFSPYSLIEKAFNGIGKLLGDKTDPPNCSGGIPSWADPQFSEDNINAPVLWCVGTDGNDPDIMEVRVVMNRPNAGSIAAAIKPVWAWSDMWKEAAPATWTQMAVGAALNGGWGEKYLIQPLGEYRFGFKRAELLDFWGSNTNQPLLEVDSHLPFVIGGLMYQAVEGNGGGGLAGAFIMMSLVECGGKLNSAAKDQSVGAAFKELLPCLNDRKDAIAAATAKAWLKLRPGANWEQSINAAKTIAKAIRAAGQTYVAAKLTLTAGTIIGDSLLDPILRQFFFLPANEELKKYLKAKYATKTEIIDLTPWSDSGNLRKSKTENGGSTAADKGICLGSSVSSRADAFRCFPAGAGVYDPCLAKPEDTSVLACMDGDPLTWKIFTGMKVTQRANVNEVAGPFYLELANGMACRLSSGAGPTPPPGYDGWAGTCKSLSGSGEVEVLWAKFESTTLYGSSVYAGKGPQGYLQTAVGPEGSQPALVDALRIYR